MLLEVTWIEEKEDVLAGETTSYLWLVILS